MTASQVAKTLKDKGFETEVLCSDMVLVGLNRKISIMEVERALPDDFLCKNIIQTRDGEKVRIHII